MLQLWSLFLPSCCLWKPISRKPFELQTSGWSQWLRLEKYFFSRSSSEVEKCHFSLNGALINEKGHFLAVFQGGVDFGSLYLGNRLSYRLLVGPNGSGLKNTFSLGHLPRLKNVILALMVLWLMKKVIFWLFFKGVLTSEAYISETVWATDFGLVPMAPARKILFL